MSYLFNLLYGTPLYGYIKCISLLMDILSYFFIINNAAVIAFTHFLV